MDNYWEGQVTSFFNNLAESRDYILHPAIIKIINEHSLSTILDYGCGDGRLMLKLDKSKYDIYLQDINPQILEVARKQLNITDDKIFNDIEAMPNDYFDCIVLSCVLMTIPHEEDYIALLKNIRKILKQNGILIIGNTHPCFIKEKFSTFSNEFSKNKRTFNYLEEGVAFNVSIKDLKTRNVTQFQDYHHSLSFLLNALINAGFVLKNIKELADKPNPINTKSYFNKLLPPFIILICN